MKRIRWKQESVDDWVEEAAADEDVEGDVHEWRCRCERRHVNSSHAITCQIRNSSVVDTMEAIELQEISNLGRLLEYIMRDSALSTSPHLRVSLDSTQAAGRESFTCSSLVCETLAKQTTDCTDHHSKAMPIT